LAAKISQEKHQNRQENDTWQPTAKQEPPRELRKFCFLGGWLSRIVYLAVQLPSKLDQRQNFQCAKKTVNYIC
jgi:hypothetical protein